MLAGKFAFRTVAILSSSLFGISALAGAQAELAKASAHKNNVKGTKRSLALPAPPKGSAPEVVGFRLPDSARPLEYKLEFEPDLAGFNFSGKETIKLEVLKACNEIFLNSLDLKIENASLKAAGAAQSQPLTVSLKPQREMAVFKAAQQLAPGRYELSLSFQGTLNDQLRGFYRAMYEDDQKRRRYLAATQMEPTDARRMFPCFDEPAYKSVFNIKAIIDKNLTALSNAPQIRQESVSAHKKAVTFEPTPQMSSYLLALVVGDLKCGGEVQGGGVPVRVWAVSGREHLGKYALSEAGKILDFESKYFAIPYLGKKMDMIAVPEFSAGAMENIGAVIFKDDALLFDQKTGSSFQKQRITGIIAHEFAHQWFGDLVTMNWWDDLWLNEAFATWFTRKVENHLHPEWRVMDESVYSRFGAMNTDALKSSRAIHADVNNASQAVEMFDGITYQKGSAVLRMLELFVGESAFQKGISKYLRRHQFANAEAEDFWTAIARESNGAPVSEIMESFVFQPGYPQLNIKVLPQGKALEITQWRQLRLGRDFKDPSLWMVPLVVRDLNGKNTGAESDESKQVSVLLKERKQKFDLDLGGKLPLLNAGGMGYYRSCYEPAYLKNLQRHFSDLSAPEKLTLISDCSSLVLPGDLPVENLYDFVNLLEFEDDPMVMNDLAGIVFKPHEFMLQKGQSEYAAFVQKIFLPLKAKVNGWQAKDSDSQQMRSLRSSVLEGLGTFGQDKKTVSEAFALFEKYKKDRSRVNPDLVNSMLSIVSFNGAAKEYDELVKLWKSAKNPADEDRALFTLSYFRQKELAAKTIAIAMSDQVKLQDGLSLLCSLASNPYTRDLGWSYVKQNWAKIVQRFPKQSLPSLAGIAAGFDTAAREAEMRAWFAGHPLPFAKTRTARALESMHAKVLFRQRYADRVYNWVIARSKT